MPRSSPWRGFLVSLSLVVLLVVSANFAGLAVSNQRAIEAELHERGNAIFGSIVLTRKWNAAAGGVFVEKGPGVVSNPFLEHPDRRGDDGTLYTMKNPALMTREISEIAEKEGAFKFHITSLRPLNPANAPDPFELEALRRFEQGATEQTGREERGGVPWYRYMAPLKVEASCLTCHARQGYQLGDVRGGISVSFSMAEAEAAIRRTRWLTLLLFAATAVLLILVIGRLVLGMRSRLSLAEARILELANTDVLTGVPNRHSVGERYQEERARAARYGRPLSVALLDLDHFKAVNDTHGHAAGDAVLCAVARAVGGALRETDLFGRWGGEEFLAVLTETDGVGARTLAERLRTAVAALRVEQAGQPLGVTVSIGIATWVPGRAGERPPEVDTLLKAADDALYRAKDGGRNRVEG